MAHKIKRGRDISDLELVDIGGWMSVEAQVLAWVGKRQETQSQSRFGQPSRVRGHLTCPWPWGKAIP